MMMMMMMMILNKLLKNWAYLFLCHFFSWYAINYNWCLCSLLFSLLSSFLTSTTSTFCFRRLQQATL